MKSRQIKAKRKAAGLSQAALAETVGVTQAAVSNWETGRAEPRKEQLRALELFFSGEPIADGSSPSQDYGLSGHDRG
jgi:transcriptional regulator with XRE-family HTH domain